MRRRRIACDISAQTRTVKPDLKEVKPEKKIYIYGNDEIPPWKSLIIEDRCFDYDEFKEVIVTDINVMQNWRDVFTIILKFLDFRILLVIKKCCKGFKLLAEQEIKRREDVLNQQIEQKINLRPDRDNWFLGTKCDGFTLELNYKESFGVFIKEKNVLEFQCLKYEEHVIIRYWGLCRVCSSRKYNLEIRDMYMEREHPKQILIMKQDMKRQREKLIIMDKEVRYQEYQKKKDGPTIEKVLQLVKQNK
jgi:hypothetical protein